MADTKRFFWRNWPVMGRRGRFVFLNAFALGLPFGFWFWPIVWREFDPSYCHLVRFFFLNN